MASRILALVLLALSVLLAPAPAAAQDSESTTSTTLAAVPDQDIVPQPNAGEAPHDPGDRGGALQLAILGLVALAIVGAVLVMVRQSRRARARSS